MQGPVKIDLAAKLALFTEHWSPKIVAELNGQQVKVVKFQGEFTWHTTSRRTSCSSCSGKAAHAVPGSWGRARTGGAHRRAATEWSTARVRTRGARLLFEPASTLNTGNVVDKRTVTEPKKI
jgi:hypothetical protein